MRQLGRGARRSGEKRAPQRSDVYAKIDPNALRAAAGNDTNAEETRWQTRHCRKDVPPRPTALRYVALRLQLCEAADFAETQRGRGIGREGTNTKICDFVHPQDRFAIVR
jgi:hypothetical protein